MTGTETQSIILWAAGILAAGWALTGIVLTYIRESHKTKRKEIEAEKEAAKAEEEKKLYETIQAITTEAIRKGEQSNDAK